MNRFYYYLIAATMISNIVASVPGILLAESRNGAILSMVLAVIAGMVIIYTTTYFFNQFPGKDLPELMKEYTSKWLTYPILLYFALSWFVAGLITFIAYVFLLITFLTPEMSIYVIAFSLAIIVSIGILIKTESVLYSAEIVLMLSSPLFIFLMFKSYSNDKLDWDFVKVSIMHVNEFPSYDAFTASLYFFMGVVNLIIFNSVFTKKQKIGAKHLITIGFSGAFILFTTYFIPIGISGFDGIENLLYPWISTSDSLRMKYGIIERVVFIFLLFFLAVSIISILIHWHVSLKLFCSIFHFKRLKWKDKNLTPYFFVIMFGVCGIVLSRVLTAYQLLEYSRFFFNLLPTVFAIILISLFAVKRGMKSQ
ncbi:GerAB/ArcD/ProY family transporter [Sporosarcina sp. FSL K6-1508]|uniref:GerAB/ArcD/ProY family transporter n=1 Tax=Sporosarcina sp. FSL K6-1508 TaxID=2921553 RepID=UPI0030FA8FB0